MKKVLPFFLFIIMSCSMGFAADPYVRKVVKTQGLHRNPDQIHNFFRSSVICDLDNGIALEIRKNWNHVSEAKSEAARGAKIYKNKKGYLTVEGTNVGPTKAFQGKFNFRHLQSEAGDDVDVVTMIKNHKFKNCPTLKKIEEKENKKRGFIRSYKTYEYTLTLSNGQQWKIPAGGEWAKRWQKGAKILVIGDQEQPCLVNVNLAQNHRSRFLSQLPPASSCLLVEAL